MPITGKQSDLSSQLTQAIISSVESVFQNTIDQQQQKGIQALCSGIANALIPFLVSNVQVNLGQNVNVPSTGLTVTVIESGIPTVIPVDGTATGTVTNNTTIS